MLKGDPQPPWLRRPQQLPAPPEARDATPEKTAASPERLMGKAEILALTGVSYPCLWEWMREGRFPRSRVIGSGGSSKSVWLRSEYERWAAALPRRKLKGDADDTNAEAT